jgi:hypothetical protein
MLKGELHPNDIVTILAGKQYRRYLVKGIREICREVLVPMENLGIGKQVQWLNSKLSNNLPNTEELSSPLHRPEGVYETQTCPSIVNL